MKNIEAKRSEKHFEESLKKKTIKTHGSENVEEIPSVTGKIFIFGSNEIGQLGFDPEAIGTVKRPRVLESLGKNIVAISISSLHNVAIDNQGKAYSWGCNDEGALGRNTDKIDEFTPAQVEGVDDVVIVKAACGDNITFLLSDEGVLYAAGTYFDENGQLGFSQEQLFQRQKTFTKYKPVQHLKFNDVACGENHTLAITKNHELYVWGWGGMFQLGRRFNPRLHGKGSGLAPERIMKNVKQVFCGSWNSFVIDENNKLYVWGLNNYGQCGFDPKKKESIVCPTLLDLGYDGTVKEVAAGQHHAVILFEDGKMFSFGRCDDGQLGIDNEIVNYRSVKAWNNSNIAISYDNLVWSWGAGESYNLGHGQEKNEPLPRKITSIDLSNHHIIDVGVGSQHGAILVHENGN
ncbi:6912_t:CDS:2 [Entrophospora sp. SA101]|nr:8870_t:CDS:2 [Entrophospora sp. SA101]CAJ0641823.1 6912_t:CDS:2 [Entrophospora sp. SA101]CAJ0907391.1 284_t:CDS:2 [Entrophospora sp. SA101]CAJ0910487.1 6435_t:CDS:2 [Entrophospora sp. SA101]